MTEIRVIPQDRFTEDDNPVFLLKSLKRKHLDSTLNMGEFCFSHPIVFNKWEDSNSAQYDRWDSHTAFRITRMVVDPVKDKETGKPDLATGKQFKVDGEMHFQSYNVSHTPVCCFRCIRRGEIEVIGNEMYYSLGETAERIEKEFCHDSFIIVPARPFLEMLANKTSGFNAMEVVYQDTLNDYPFLPLNNKHREIVEQVFRKDKKYAWQKEYRISLLPTKESPVFVSVGSIKEIAVYGKIRDLKEKKCIYEIVKSHL